MALLDQVLMEDIARQCPQKLFAFHQCMQQPQSVASCVDEQKALTECIKEVPAYNRIQGQCADKLQEYELCLRGSSGAVLVCQPQLKALRECSAKALDAK